jgi:sortase (surface protein transpeptidase)
VDRATRPRGVRRTLLSVPAYAAVGLGALLINQGLNAPTPPPQPSAAQGFPNADTTRTSPRPQAAPAPLAPSTPTRVRIPSIKVNAPLTALDLQPDGHLAAPPDDDRNLAGWYKDGTSPGAVGTAIIAGHVDTRAGAAVFYSLGALRKGNQVDIDLANGATAGFTIDAVAAYTSRQFPDHKVYDQAERPELRLITCGAGFDKTRQQYLGNVVAYAHLTSTRTR